MKYNKNKVFHIISILLFAAYIIALCYFLFFAENLGRSDTSSFHYNFIPLKEIRRYIVYCERIGIMGVLLNLFGNILAFVPMGLFLPMVTKERIKGFSVILVSFELSVLVEALQLFTKVGSCDIDDVILNTIGGMIGCIIYYVIKHVRRVRSGQKTTKKI